MGKRVFTTKRTARQSRNRNSENLSQRRKVFKKKILSELRALRVLRGEQYKPNMNCQQYKPQESEVRG
jgi:hypothetical protein